MPAERPLDLSLLLLLLLTELLLAPLLSPLESIAVPDPLALPFWLAQAFVSSVYLTRYTSSPNNSTPANAYCKRHTHCSRCGSRLSLEPD